MTTLRVEQLGQDLIIRIPPEANAALRLHAGEAVTATRAQNGELALAPADTDHQLRADRHRAFLRRVRKAL